MGLEISQNAVLYLVLMLVVILVGVYFVTGLNIVKVISGKNQFDVPTIKITSPNFPTSNDFPLPTPGSNQYTFQVNSLTIDLLGAKDKVFEVYPILDVGDNPLMPDGYITCTYNSDTEKYDCSSKDPNVFRYTLSFDKLQNSNNFRNPNIYVQLYFFKKTDAIKQYIDNSILGSKRTTSNLLSTFTDFYINNVQMPSFSNDGQYGEFDLTAYCNSFSNDPDKVDECDRNDECYYDGGTGKCVYCGHHTECSDFDKQASCEKCIFKKCIWTEGDDSVYRCESV